MENMRSVLTAGDSSFAQVVKTTILLADIKDFRQWAGRRRTKKSIRSCDWALSVRSSFRHSLPFSVPG